MNWRAILWTVGFLFLKNNAKIHPPYTHMDKSSGKKQLAIVVACVAFLFAAIIAANLLSPHKPIEPVSDRWAVIKVGRAALF